MIIPVNNLGQFGLTPDIPYTEQPINAWTRGQNIRFRNNSVEKITGHSEVYATPVCAPYWLLPVPGGFWLYAGLTAVGATDGNSHADITRAAGAYAATAEKSWTGTIIEGIPVITNGVDIPQMWNTPALATDLIALSNWDTNHICGSMRSLKRYLVAMDVTKSGTRNPYLVKWSDAAPTAGVPASWDYTDKAIDAGEYSLPTTGGDVLDGVPLRDDLVIYRQSEAWRMSYIGNIDIFKFTKMFDSIGMINKRCAVMFFSGQHLVWTGDDLVLHDGVQAKSVLDQRAKRLVFATVDSAKYKHAYLAVNYANQEVWCCFVESGYTFPNKAIIWNWLLNTITTREMPNAAFAMAGYVAPAGDVWSSSNTSWTSDTGLWSDDQPTPNARKLLIAGTNDTKLYAADATNQFNAVSMTAFVERTALGFPLKQDTPPDFTTEKLWRGIWPRITGTAGGVVNVYIGTQEVPNGAVTWGSAMPFTIGTSTFLDFLSASRLHAIKFESTGDLQWTLAGYDADVVPIGSR